MARHAAPGQAAPIRRCISCRRRAPKAALVRLAAAGEKLAVDGEARLPGRGAYLCPHTSCLRHAVRDGGRRLLRALRADPGRVTVDAEDVTEGWEAALRSRSVEVET